MLLLSRSQMAPAVADTLAFDAATSATGTGSVTLTFSHTVGGGSNRVLWVGLQANTDVVSGVTYNGVAMTLGKKQVRGASAQTAYLYYLTAPASGAHNVVISQGAITSLQATASSYTGAHQSSQATATSSADLNSQTAPYAVNLTTPSDQCWVVGFLGFVGGAGGVPAAGAATAARGTPSTLQVYVDSNAAVHPAASRNLNVTSFGTSDVVMVAAAMAPSG